MMKYWVEEKIDWDDLWIFARLFAFESDAEAWIRKESKMRDIPIKSFRIINTETDEIKYFE